MDSRLLLNAAGQVHIVRRDATGQWTGEERGRSNGSFALAVGSDGRPRVSNHVDGDLLLMTRDILWLDNHALLPTQWR